MLFLLRISLFGLIVFGGVLLKRLLLVVRFMWWCFVLMSLMILMFKVVFDYWLLLKVCFFGCVLLSL